MIIEVVGDLICPWSRIGRARLARALASRPGVAVEIRWRPFQLHPDLPAIGVARDTWHAARFGGLPRAARVEAAVAEAGAAEGLRFHFERIRRLPRTLDAHRLMGLAARHRLAEPMAEALYSAYFEEGRDIGDLGVLIEVAAGLGLDQRSVHSFLVSDLDRAAVLAAEAESRRMGITGVPCFILAGRYALAGAQEPEFFLPLIDLARQEEMAAA